MKHGTFNQETRLTYNAHTNKWVKRLRDSQKGQFKGTTATNKLKGIEVGDFMAWLPIKLSKEHLTHLFDSIWYDCTSKDWEMDKILATFYTYYMNRYFKGFKNECLKNDGFLYISTKQFRKYVHDTEYINYLQVLETASILEIKEFENPYDSIKPLKQFRVSPSLLEGDKQWYKVPYETDRFKLKCYNLKQQRIKINDANETRQQLAIWAKELIKGFDTDSLTLYLTKKVNRSKTKDWDEVLIKKRTARDILTMVQEIKEGNSFWVNCSDDFGNRFHSPFTNINSFLLKYLTIDGDPVSEVDLVNSQMFFFTLAFEDFDLVYPLLKDQDSDGNIRGALRTIEREKDKADIQQFITWARTGLIYEKVGEHLGISRKWAKKKLFKILFSNAEQCSTAKQQIYSIFPTIVELSNVLNKHNLIPLITQRLESKITIDSVCSRIIHQGLGPIATCHDSIICPNTQYEEVSDIISSVFNGYGLPVPEMRGK